MFDVTHIENNKEFQGAVKELGFEGKQLTESDMVQVFNCIQEAYCLIL